MSRPANRDPLEVDWPLALCLLRKHRPLAQLAPLVRMDEHTMNRLARGEVREPRFSQGVRILDLAADLLCPADLERLRRSSEICRHG